MAHYGHTIEAIQDGKLGRNEGLSHGKPRMRDYIPNVQKGQIYLIGGVSGSGKSALAIDMFVMNPYEDYLRRLGTSREVKLKIFIWSIEISPEILIAKMICLKIWREHRILIDLNYVLSRGENKLDDRVLALILGYQDYFKHLEEVVIILDADNPTGIRNTLTEYLMNHGRIEDKVYIVKHKDGREEKRSRFHKYVSDDEGLHVIGIIDHVSIMRKERGFSKKENIDKMMEYALDLVRNFKITMVPLQQLNRNIESTDRQKMSLGDPQRSDFKETSDSTDLAHNILGICYPQAWELANYRGYRISDLGNRFRGVKIIKNRDGNADKVFGMRFVGEVGEFTELPVPSIPGKTIANAMTEDNYTQIQSITKYNFSWQA